MAQPRPQSYLALALATLALTLATWWAWVEFSGPGSREDEEAARTPWLPPGDDAPPLPTPEPALEPRTAELPEGTAPDGPPLPPAEPLPPVVVAPSRAGDGATNAQPEVVVFDEADTEEREDDNRALTSRARLLGGVARPNERATPEVAVRGSSAWIGTPADWVANLAGQRSKVPYVALPMEAPRHIVEFEDFWIDRFEVPNSRYAAFLGATARVLYRTADQPARTIQQITRYLIQDPPDNLDLDTVTSKQLFMANSGVLMQAFGGAVVKNKDDVVDFDATFESIKDRIVPAGVDLSFYTRAPPGHWPDDLHPREEPDHPVRDVSVEDAMAFALWAGRFVPTELQWEYAARGRDGSDWPWGSDGSEFAQRVKGGSFRAPGEEPQTVSVYQFAGGASWVGAFQMAGNVSEWTSSFLDAYPGGSRTLPGSPEREVVVRGGSAFDQEPYVMRPAFRGWLATDPDGAPRAMQRRAWTGFRTARYGASFRVDAIHGRVPTMHFRARKGRRLERALLQDEVFAGFEGQHAEAFQRIVDEPVDEARRKSRPGWKTVVVNPLAVVGRIQRGRWAPNTDEDFSSPEHLARDRFPVAYAILHTDVHLLDTWHSAVEPYDLFELPSRLVRDDVPPGSYLVVSVQGVLALMKPDLTDVWYLSNRRAPEARLNVIERDYPAGLRKPEVPTFRVVGPERVDVDLRVPMHPAAEPGLAARVVLRLVTDPRETSTLLDVRQAPGSR